MAEIRVLVLLRKYKRWVRAKKIDFLQNAGDCRVVVENLDSLISDFKRAERKEKEARKKRRKASLSDFLDWHETHKKGVKLWRNLTSCALKHIDETSKGNSRLFEFLDAATDFEDLLYGLERYYRDHTLHSLWVYFLGEHILRNHLPEIRKDMEWYFFNDIEDEKDTYKYSKEVVDEGRKRQKEIREDIDKRKDAVWCIVALCHDLGYSLAKLEDLNKKAQAVLKFYDVPYFRQVGYSLDIEHQYLVAQFLEIMAMDVRIVPSEKHKDTTIDVKEKVLVKCYRDDSIYWDFCKALEKKQHGFLSSYLVYKVVSMFADTAVRGPAEAWGIEDEEAGVNIIMGNILYAMAIHTLEFTYLNSLGSLADILILADELEEFSRLGRQLLSRKYFDTMAFCEFEFQKNRSTKKLGLNIVYKVASHRSLGDFFVRKAEQLCRIYSLEEQETQERRWQIEGITITCKKRGKRVSFHLDANPRKTRGLLPDAKVLNRKRSAKKFMLFCDEDKLFVRIGPNKVSIRDWFKNLSDTDWRDDGFIEG